MLRFEERPRYQFIVYKLLRAFWKAKKDENLTAIVNQPDLLYEESKGNDIRTKDLVQKYQNYRFEWMKTIATKFADKL